MEAMTIVWFFVGCAVGGVIAWLVGSSRFQGARAAAEARVMAREAEVAGLRDGIVAKDRVIEEKVREVEAQRIAATSPSTTLKPKRAKPPCVSCSAAL